MNERNTNMIKTVIYLFLLGLMILPAIQKKWKIFEEEPLKGALPEYVKPKPTFKTWWSGDYQDSVDIYIKGTGGFQPSLVRIHNEIHYRFYNVAIANGVIIGKNGYLYEENYIKAYTGIDFLGEDSIKKKVAQIEKVSKRLEEDGKTLIILFAPGKASFYPEYIPDRFLPDEIGPNNYDTYQKLLSTSHVNFLNFHRYFRSIKETSPYPLMPKTGIHWSKYAEVLAADSLLSYLEKNCGCEYPNLIIDTIETSDNMEDTDDDIEDGMNLFSNIPDLTMGYPRFHMETTGNEAGKKVLTIADSYYWGMYNFGLSRDYFNRGQFWYYYEHIYGEDIPGPLKPEEIDFGQEIKNHDVFVIIATDANLYKLGYGFIDQLYEMYFPNE